MARLGLQCDKCLEGLYMYVCMYAFKFVCTYGSECMYVCILVTGIYQMETATGIGIRTAL